MSSAPKLEPTIKRLMRVAQLVLLPFTEGTKGAALLQLPQLLYTTIPVRLNSEGKSSMEYVCAHVLKTNNYRSGKKLFLIKLSG